MEDWANALAECIEAENLAFGETILIRGKSLKASLGSSQQGEAFEVGGYLDTDTLNLVLPASELLQLSDPPDINEIIEIRNRGYRVQMRRTLEAGHGYELQVALVPQYIPERPTEPIYITPTPVSELFAERITSAPTEVIAEASPAKITDLQGGIVPAKPDQIIVGATPLQPSELEAETPFIDMYLVMGQSNAHGHSPIADLTTEQSHNIQVGFLTSWHHSTSNATTTQYYSDYKTHMYIGETRGDDNETTVDSDKFGIEWGFAKQLDADHEGHDKIGILKYAVGSSTIDDNATFSDWDITKNTECFQGFKNALADALPKIRNAGYNIRWQGFLWYQGESNGGMNPSTYQGHLETLISAIETELGVTDLPCVFCAPAEQSGNDLIVNEAFNNLARTRNDYDFIKISDYHDGSYYNVHLSAQNMYDAGIAAGQAMRQATTHQAPTSNPFNAGDITTRLWLDMDDQASHGITGGSANEPVTIINDKSGNGYSFTPRSGSTIRAITNQQNGKNIFRFNGNADATNASNITFDSTARHKWFIVSKVFQFDAFDTLLLAQKGNPTLQLILFNLSGSGNFLAEWYVNPGTHLRGNTTNLLNQWVMLSVEWDVPNAESSAWLNGTAYNTKVAQSGLSGFGAMNVTLNKYTNIGDSDWGELIFAENITQAESDKIEGYLANKWGLRGNLPTSHPYKIYNP